MVSIVEVAGLQAFEGRSSSSRTLSSWFMHAAGRAVTDVTGQRVSHAARDPVSVTLSFPRLAAASNFRIALDDDNDDASFSTLNLFCFEDSEILCYGASAELRSLKSPDFRCRSSLAFSSSFPS